MGRKAELGNHLKLQRFLNGNMTQEDLAHRVGVTRQTIISLEGGRYTPSLILAIRLARIFGMPVEELFILEE